MRELWDLVWLLPSVHMLRPSSMCLLPSTSAASQAVISVFRYTWGLPHLSASLLQSANFTSTALKGHARQSTPVTLGDSTNAWARPERTALPRKDAGASGLDVLARMAAQAGQQPLPVGQA